MKIAVLTDAHSNMLALDAVMNHAHSVGVDSYWYLGDYVGYGPHPNEVIECIAEECDKAIIGNYDQKVLEFPKFEKQWETAKHPDKFFSFGWSYREMKHKNSDFLKSLNHEDSFELNNTRFLLCHGSPEGIADPLNPWTQQSRFDELAKGTKADIILFGHTHIFFTNESGQTLFVNPGGVSRSFDEDPRASYVVLEYKKKTWSVSNYRLEYDYKKFKKDMKKVGFSKLMTKSIMKGINYDILAGL